MIQFIFETLAICGLCFAAYVVFDHYFGEPDE